MEELRKYLEKRICNLSKIVSSVDGYFVRGAVEDQRMYAKISAFLEVINYIDNIKNK